MEVQFDALAAQWQHAVYAVQGDTRTLLTRHTAPTAAGVLTCGSPPGALPHLAALLDADPRRMLEVYYVPAAAAMVGAVYEGVDAWRADLITAVAADPAQLLTHLEALAAAYVAAEDAP